MKAVHTVEVRTTRGMVSVPAFHIWQETVEGVTLAVSLHVSPVDAKKLMISELGTGFATGAVALIPKEKQVMLKADAERLPGKLVKRQARTAFHHLLKRIGSLDFIRGLAKAQILVAKEGEDLNNIYAGTENVDSGSSQDTE